MDILEVIWSDTLELRQGSELPPLAGIFSPLLAAPLISFTFNVNRPLGRPLVRLAGDEVMPGASLADVLFEEFEIEISDDTIVLIEPLFMSDTESFSSQDLGQALGQILVELAGHSQPETLRIVGLGKPDMAHQMSRSVVQRTPASPIQ